MRSFALPQGFYCQKTKIGKEVENLCLGKSRGTQRSHCARKHRSTRGPTQAQPEQGWRACAGNGVFVSFKLESHLECISAQKMGPEWPEAMPTPKSRVPVPFLRARSFLAFKTVVHSPPAAPR